MTTNETITSVVVAIGLAAVLVVAAMECGRTSRENSQIDAERERSCIAHGGAWVDTSSGDNCVFPPQEPQP